MKIHRLFVIDLIAEQFDQSTLPSESRSRERCQMARRPKQRAFEKRPSHDRTRPTRFLQPRESLSGRSSLAVRLPTRRNRAAGTGRDSVPAVAPSGMTILERIFKEEKNPAVSADSGGVIA